MKNKWNIRPAFLIAFFVITLASMHLSQMADAQVLKSYPFAVSTPTSTQIIAGAGGSAYSPTAVGIGVVTIVGTPGSFQLVSGSVDGETPGCNTNRNNLTGAVTVTASASGDTQIMIIGTSQIAVPASSPLCVVTTNTSAINGWVTANK